MVFYFYYIYFSLCVNTIIRSKIISDFIEEFYYGNIEPQECTTELKPKVMKCLNELAQKEKHLFDTHKKRRLFHPRHRTQEERIQTTRKIRQNKKRLSQKSPSPTLEQIPFKGHAR